MINVKLNVGCGADTWGNVRLDVSRKYWMARGKSSANILADAQHLPFRNKSFGELRAHEVLEHLPYWRLALSEFCRVSKKISITVPVDSFLPRNDWMILFLPTPTYLRFLVRLPQRAKEHLWQFNVNVLESLLKKAGFSHVETEVINYPIFGFLAYGRKGKYFQLLSQRFNRPHSWKIIAYDDHLQ